MKYFLKGKGFRTLPRLMLTGALAISIAGCNTDELVKVADPSGVTPEGTTLPAAIPSLVAGAYRQFTGGYDGLGLDDAFLMMSALITDEFYWGDTFTTRNVADHRSLNSPVLGNISDPAYGRLQQARFFSRRAFAAVSAASTPATQFDDEDTMAQLRTVEAYTFVTLSEGWCGNVPFSRQPDTGPIDPTLVEYQPGIGTVAMNDSAVVKFDQALGLNPGNRLTAVGKGRALLNVGRYAEAAAAVSAVPTTYVFLFEHTVNTNAENNPSFALQDNGRYGVSNLEGGLNGTAALRPDPTAPGTTAPSAEGLPFRGLRDPRVPWEQRPGLACFSGSVRCFIDNNNPTLEADVPLASGVEARLIEAENDLNSGNIPAMLAKLNALRANVTQLVAVMHPQQKQTFRDAAGGISLPPLVDPADPLATPAAQFASQRDMLFRERALWLFNTGHRQGDLRRLARNYGLATNAVFPSGPHFRGGSFGNDVAFPLPFNEANNTKYNPSLCSTTTP